MVMAGGIAYLDLVDVDPEFKYNNTKQTNLK